MLLYNWAKYVFNKDEHILSILCSSSVINVVTGTQNLTNGSSGRGDAFKSAEKFKGLHKAENSGNFSFLFESISLIDTSFVIFLSFITSSFIFFIL